MITIAACGKVKEKWMRDGIEEYAKRIRAYDKLTILEVQDEKTPDGNSDALNEMIKKKEGERLLKQIRPDDYMVLLDLKGKEFTSEGFAAQIEKIHTFSSSRITFVIGGSLGVSDEVIRRADLRWKLSDCTFPHQLCRLIVLEQIYRAYRIMNHEPYHK